jgi:4-amino-4-deoxychorismate lyase
MSRLIESIRLEDGQFARLPFHQERMNRALKALFGLNPRWTLAEILSAQAVPQKGLFKCRLLYDDSATSVEFIRYTIQPAKTLKIVHNDNIEYAHKLEDRTALKKAWEKRGDCDDVLIIKEGMVTDSSYANIVFCRESRWITPKSVLLPGTMRQYLLKTNKITEDEIAEVDIQHFESFKLINALLGWDGPKLDVSNIH